MVTNRWTGVVAVGPAQAADHGELHLSDVTLRHTGPPFRLLCRTELRVSGVCHIFGIDGTSDFVIELLPAAVFNVIGTLVLEPGVRLVLPGCRPVGGGDLLVNPGAVVEANQFIMQGPSPFRVQVGT